MKTKTYDTGLTVFEWDGKPITEPGIYSGISMDDYHGQLTDGPSASSSGLRCINTKSVLHFWHESYFNPNRIQPEKKHFDFGKAVHDGLMDPERLEQDYAFCPFTNWNTNEKIKDDDGQVIFEWKTKTPKDFDPDKDEIPEGIGYKPLWKDEQRKAGRTVVMPDQMEHIKAMRAVAEKEPVVMAGAFQGLVEHSIVWKCQETGLWLKARPDVLPHDDWIVDYKSTAEIFPFKRHRSIIDYGYHQQLALVAEGLAAVGRPIPTNFVLLFQEKEAPFCCVSERLSWETIRQGAMLNLEAKQKLAKAIETGEWEGPEQPVSDFYAPEWYQKQMQGREDRGEIRAPDWVEEMAKENKAFFQAPATDHGEFNIG